MVLLAASFRHGLYFLSPFKWKPRWAKEHLRLLDCREAMRKAGLDKTQMEEKLEWLRKIAPKVRC